MFKTVFYHSVYPNSLGAKAEAAKPSPATAKLKS